MELASTKRASTNNLSLINLLCVGASYLACVSCEGMEKKDFSLSSHTQCADNASDLIKLDSDYFEKDIEPSGSLYKLSESEIFPEWLGIINGNQKPPISNRRVPDDYLPGELEKFMKLGKVRAHRKLADTTGSSTTDLISGLK